MDTDKEVTALFLPARVCFLPLLRTLKSPFPSVENGHFDAVDDGTWQATSSQDESLIYADEVVADTLGHDFSAHSSPNLAWLGGIVNEEATIRQRIWLPPEYPDVRLSFWHVIGSNERSYGDDRGYLELDSATLTTTDLCKDTNTDGWQRVEVSLADYVGTTVDVTFRSTQDGQEISNWFLDDVLLCDGTSAYPCE